MKITRRQLIRIIKEEKARLAENGDSPRAGGRMSANPAGALEEIYAGIDKLIYAIGNEKAYLELVGIVETWEDN